MVGQVGEVGSQSRPGTSVGVGKLHCVILIRCPRGLRPMGSNANLGKELMCRFREDVDVSFRPQSSSSFCPTRPKNNDRRH